MPRKGRPALPGCNFTHSISIPIGPMISTSLRLVPVLALALASPAAAQEGGLLTPSSGLIFWTILTFGIVFLALWKFAWPHLLGAVEAREQHIRELLDAAARDREEARELVEEHKRQMEELRTRAQDVIAESRAAGERMREEMLTETRREQEVVLDRAQREIQQQTERALAVVRRDAVELAIAAASKLVGKNFDADDNRRLVRDFMERVDSGPRVTTTAGV